MSEAIETVRNMVEMGLFNQPRKTEDELRAMIRGVATAVAEPQRLVRGAIPFDRDGNFVCTRSIFPHAGREPLAKASRAGKQIHYLNGFRQDIAPRSSLSSFPEIWQGDEMVDIVDAETRSRIMRNIRGKNTKPELTLRRALHARGFRYHLHHNGLPGRPDLVFPKHGAAVFVHGCFWHRHPGCPKATTSATREGFWQNKFAENTARDQRNIDQLKEAGWRVLVVWECELGRRAVGSTVGRVSAWLMDGNIS